MNALFLTATLAMGGVWTDAFTVVDLDWTGSLTETHTAQPTTKPTVLRHTKHYGCLCPEMCLGQHLVNAHGVTNDDWNRLRLWESNQKRIDYHAKLHREGVYEKPKPTSGCPPGGCPAPRQRLRLFQRLRQQ